MFGTQATIVRTPLLRSRAEHARQPSGLSVLVPVVIGHIGTDEVLDRAMLRALFTQIHALPADDDFRLEQPPTAGTEAAGHSQVGVITEIHRNGPGGSDK